MILRRKLLEGPHEAWQQIELPNRKPELIVDGQLVISRKRDRSVPVRHKDGQAWRLVEGKNDGSRELVFRSPIDPNEWLTPGERALIVGSLLHERVPLASLRGFVPILDPKEGQLGFFTIESCSRRERRQYRGGRWGPYRRTYDL